jgi:hypothetical protein
MFVTLHVCKKIKYRVRWSENVAHVLPEGKRQLGNLGFYGKII